MSLGKAGKDRMSRSMDSYASSPRRIRMEPRRMSVRDRAIELETIARAIQHNDIDGDSDEVELR